MKVFVLKGRKVFTVILASFMIAATVFAILVSRPDVLSAFSEGKDLPIYSVDYPEKKVAITFDCAWGAGI